MADQLTTIAIVQADGNLAKVPDALITPRILVASRILSRMISAEVYAVLLAEGAGPFTERYVACQQAETLVTIAKLLYFLAHDASGKGIVGSNILGDAHSKLIDFDEIKERHNVLMQEAKEIIAPYIYDPDTDADDETQDDSVRFPGASIWVV